MESSTEIIVFLGNFKGHVVKCAENFESVHGGNGRKKCRRKKIARVL